MPQNAKLITQNELGIRAPGDKFVERCEGTISVRGGET
jgi:hypothetical protein